MRIAVVGSGYVGLVAGACFADLGHDVVLVDNDERKLAALKSGQVPIHENFLPELLNRHRGHRLTFSDDLREAVRASASRAGVSVTALLALELCQLPWGTLARAFVTQGTSWEGSNSPVCIRAVNRRVSEVSMSLALNVSLAVGIPWLAAVGSELA